MLVTFYIIYVWFPLLPPTRAQHDGCYHAEQWSTHWSCLDEISTKKGSGITIMSSFEYKQWHKESCGVPKASQIKCFLFTSLFTVLCLSVLHLVFWYFQLPAPLLEPGHVTFLFTFQLWYLVFATQSLHSELLSFCKLWKECVHF